MWTVNRVLTTVFDGVYALCAALPPWASLTILSGLLGVVALVVVKYCSNQAAIGKVKDDVKANLLSIKLFKDELAPTLKAQLGLVWAAARMQWHMLPPVLVMFIPFCLMAFQMGLRHQWRPLWMGDEAMVTVALRDDARRSALDMEASAPEGVEFYDRVRIPGTKEVVWRVRAEAPGRHTVEFVADGQRFAKELVVSDGFERVSPKRPDRGFVDQLLYPAEAPFSADSLVQSIEIVYPPRDSWFTGSDWWALWFLVLSIVIALVFKPLLGVKF